MGAASHFLRSVSFHAVTRYVQRVLGIVVTGATDARIGTEKCALLHADAAGLTLDGARDAVLAVPGVMAGIEGGASRVKSGGMWYVIVTTAEGARVVCTVVETRNRREHIIDRREQRDRPRHEQPDDAVAIREALNQ